MEDTAAVRRAALDTFDDVEPVRLRDRIEARLRSADLAPGLLTVESARAARDGAFDGVVDRAAAVQGVYEGLRLTRSLAHADPWGGDAVANGVGGAPTDRDEADLAVLVADILVARGFHVLARTEVASRAVGVIQTFGSDQTVRRQTGDAALDRNLEADILELSIRTGITGVGASPGPGVAELAADLTAEGLPSTDRVASGEVRDRLAALVRSRPTPTEGVTTSAED